MIGIVFGFLRALSPRAWATILLAAAAAFVVAQILSWVHGKEAAAGRAINQRNAAVRAFMESERDLIVARANVATLQTAIDRQNASIRALAVEQAATAHRLEEAAQQARSATAAANRRASALLAGRAGPDPCRSALDVARSLP